MKTFQYIVEDYGIRLDKYVGEKCPDLSRSQAQKLIEQGRITVNGKAAKSSLKLLCGDKIDISIPAPAPSDLVPEEIPLKIIYEDQDLLVIDKPAGLTVHPAPGHYTHTLANAILAHVPEIESGGSDRPGIVHRLDKDTSGLIVVAKNTAAHMKLADQFKNRLVSKTYLALVRGRLSPEQGIIEANIGRNPKDRKQMAIVSHGREARTEYQVIRYLNNFSLVEVKPKTGRTHQIRVHLAAIGYPIAGDTVYGIKTDFLTRQFLHACKLCFRIPSTGEYREFKSELPQDLAQALNAVAEQGNK